MKFPEKCINLSGGGKAPYMRSGYEFSFAKYLDLNIKVKKWASELVKIEYVHPLDGKIHNYIPDFLAAIEDNNGNIINYLIEIKPKNQSMLLK